MRRRLTVRTVAVSVLIVAVVAVVLGALAIAIGRQRDAGQRARHSQSVIAAANLTQQRLLAVQTTIRGFLIRGNADLLDGYRDARAGLPAAALELQLLVERDPAQRRLAELIREQALGYVNTYADPVIARTREEGVSAGRSFASASEGATRADNLIALIDRLAGAERTLSMSLADDADAASDRALLIAWLGLAACVLALALATAFVARRIVMPVGRLAAAAERVRRGELDVSVPERSGDEIGRLGGAFNAMARALEQSRGELESQNTELELQAIALEERSTELAEAGDEARAQRDELEHTAVQLALEKRRAERYGDFVERLASSLSRDDLARIVLETLARAAGADVGVLYAQSWRDDSAGPRRVLGLDPAGLVEHVVAGGEGASARAVDQRRVLVLDDAPGLRVRSALAGELPVRWEVHLPLTYGGRTTGVVTLGGVSSGAYRDDEGLTLERLAGQAAVALAEACALAERKWLSKVNAAGRRRRPRGDRARRARPRARVREHRDGAARAVARDARRRRDRRPRRRGRPVRGVGGDARRGRRADRRRADDRRAGCSSATRPRSTTRRAPGWAGWSCCETSRASARSSSSNPT